MHEELLLRDLVEKVDEIARAQHARSVRSIHLWVGALSHLSPSQLRARWPEAAVGTASVNATLEFDPSEDTQDPRAQSIVLTRLVVDSDDGAPGSV